MITVTVKVSAGARTEKIEEISPGIFKIRVQAPPEKGKANKRIIEMLAEHYNVSVTSVILTAGSISRDKKLLIDK